MRLSLVPFEIHPYENVVPLTGNTWFSPVYGANGIYYRVVLPTLHRAKGSPTLSFNSCAVAALPSVSVFSPSSSPAPSLTSETEAQSVSAWSRPVCSPDRRHFHKTGHSATPVGIRASCYFLLRRHPAANTEPASSIVAIDSTLTTLDRIQPEISTTPPRELGSLTAYPVKKGGVIYCSRCVMGYVPAMPLFCRILTTTRRFSA
jgi:hypothetical protein